MRWNLVWNRLICAKIIRDPILRWKLHLCSSWHSIDLFSILFYRKFIIRRIGKHLKIRSLYILHKIFLNSRNEHCILSYGYYCVFLEYFVIYEHSTVYTVHAELQTTVHVRSKLFVLCSETSCFDIVCIPNNLGWDE